MYIPYEKCFFPYGFVFKFNKWQWFEKGKLYAEKCGNKITQITSIQKVGFDRANEQYNERRENKFCQIGMNYLIEQSHRSHTLARHPCRYTITVHSK